jgi:23S rRNA (guanine745-N1)-methyltransferase
VPAPPLACSVRACGRPLTRRADALVCDAGHAHDVARSGYVNLLQPQDRRSRAAGDTRAAVQARSDLLRGGVGRHAIDEIVRLALATSPAQDAVVVDLGSGSGDALGSVAARHGVGGVGIDLSTAAAEHAAPRNPALTWVVANAARKLTLRDGSVDLVLSLHGRRNPVECARVLRAGGTLLVALPAPDDLIELRALVQGQGFERDRTGAMLAEHQPLFTVVDRTSERHVHTLDRESILSLLRSTYRGGRRAADARVAALGSLTVTLSTECVVLRRRSAVTRPGSTASGPSRHPAR